MTDIDQESRVLHVHRTGCDQTGDGTRSNPFRTVDHAAQFPHIAIFENGYYNWPTWTSPTSGPERHDLADDLNVSMEDVIAAAERDALLNNPDSEPEPDDEDTIEWNLGPIPDDERVSRITDWAYIACWLLFAFGPALLLGAAFAWVATS